MKKLLIACGFLVFGVTASMAQADAITKYFDKYLNDESFSVVYISPKMFDLVSKLDVDDMDQDTKDVLKDLKGLRILTKNSDGQKYYQEAMNILNTKEYETLMTVRDGDSNVRFWVKEDPANSNRINELLLLVGGEDFALISFIGNIDLKKISKLSDKMDVKGMEHLEDLDKKQKND
ncbi:MAG TPA: DUF4252 domain-containing protein [Saprospiraceae bacterium]|nr:DUF4252 domain-containing protein [Saprospiraceae bacterium]MCB9269002.1 DUF4252 domain-containing protein [Lewinellaceae bacterium]HPG08045.1 DUF4252 domain-containing protein [Saprospiraceae bacterium]HPR00516.1 DUF4252 domain-containing protein [Saprospiraceae bacterium]HQU52158.1 DUF4252 domain-containing protein [Saprospiraceae bacterium]